MNYKTSILLVLLIATQNLVAHILMPMLHWDEIRGTGYVSPAFASQVEGLRGSILAAARQHNQPARSGMSDDEFAVVLTVLLYTEHNGWFEDLVPPVRYLTPIYQDTQRVVNAAAMGTDYSLWPSNLRPTVALEILEGQLPVPDPKGTISVTVEVAGSNVKPELFASQEELLAAISRELERPDLAVEYLAANVARGIERAHYEGVPVTWQALAAWHNQGIVRPDAIAANPFARSYVMRAALYFPRAQALISGASEPLPPD